MCDSRGWKRLRQVLDTPHRAVSTNLLPRRRSQTKRGLVRRRARRAFYALYRRINAPGLNPNTQARRLVLSDLGRAAWEIRHYTLRISASGLRASSGNSKKYNPKEAGERG